jgi:hypothetical protein
MEAYPDEPTVHELNAVYRYQDIHKQTKLIGVTGFGEREVAAVAALNAAFAAAYPVDLPLDAVLADIERRDDIDAHRALSPLRPADDAVIVDTERLDIGGVLAAIARIIAERAERRREGDGHG